MIEMCLSDCYEWMILTEKLGIGRIRIRNDLFRVRILQKVPDPTGSGSTTLGKTTVTVNTSFKDFRAIITGHEPVLRTWRGRGGRTVQMSKATVLPGLF